ncbi:MAG: Uma2 family endonuclease [Labilithrix sp.]|nr:Uma2 family endonuclease [Labilithrix sp.]MCW5815073.1 Uma2 family endonuclease [Labilithrix sp.]
MKVHDKKGRVVGEAVTNPILLLEVLSPSTEDYDRGEKFAHYMRLPVTASRCAARSSSSTTSTRPERGVLTLGARARSC